MTALEVLRPKLPEDRRNRRRISGAILWSIFAAGLLVQLLAPRLKIENNAFVIPQSLVSEGKSLAPDEIVFRERTFRTLSAVLTLAGALSLAFHYRGVLTGRPHS